MAIGWFLKWTERRIEVARRREAAKGADPKRLAELDQALAEMRAERSKHDR